LPVANTRQVNGTNPWTLLEQTWTAGADTHVAKICVSRDPSDNPETRIAGDAWVDDVNLAPLPSERRKP
jgi:hypothetical protein